MTISARTLDFFDRHIIQAIMEKYGLPEMQAIKQFIQSETYQMLIDEELELYQVSPLILFDMWECEQITGNPRNSLYLRSNAL
ncbi:hypothetical protein [Wielerella bovis]|uniref:hypothetical protein n=1 Tax=Wielerella bovis TaxID=2917790 RepID=UPI0020187999|nr:hypothetical protein [Wielerella bovis]ULJ60962.1 hypothetical protein MIS44_03665 [Wielerella bovis]ULJ63087.1 hypothetical protein MIS46_03265 [Wielerella bovis]ULJ65317.1 hypothetical protein MIS33_03330 [Wielerella bovis]ULJ67664.1 hypothetical protein MIS31_03705 [Wielerella bovis]